MPVWHEAAKPYVDGGKLAILGVIQEQHAERCRLFAQWKQLDWPIVQDSMCSLNLSAVPIAIFIDEHGIVRDTRPRPGSLAKFIDREFAAPEKKPESVDLASLNLTSLAEKAKTGDSPAIWRQLGDAYLNWGTSEQIGLAIEAYGKSAKLSKGKPPLHFRIGVAYRKRFDSASSNTEDFDQAVRHWTAALDHDPNQYIWRRRIQQYGPRQIKPYPFYDWVPTAMADIKQRGQTPVELKVSLSGAELAKPQRTFSANTDTTTNPDPNSKIELDAGKMIQIRPTVVPSTVKPGSSVRVHLRFDPKQAKWNNEAEPLTIWIDAGNTSVVSDQLIRHDNPSSPESQEARVIEFEYQTPSSGTECTIGGYALYNVCSPDDGQCLYRRQDFSIVIPLKK